MIDADRLIDNIDAYKAVYAKKTLEQSKTAVERFDWAIKEIESHRADIENAGKVLKHWGTHIFHIKIYRPHMDSDQLKRALFRYDELEGGRLRCGYTTGSTPNIGWLTDGSLKIGYNWSVKIDAVRDGILHGLNDHVVDGCDISYKQVVDALIQLARLYPEIEKNFINYFESLGK